MIEASEEAIPSPEPFYTPGSWQMHKAKSWIKIKNFIDWADVDDEIEYFIIVSSGKGLDQVLQKSQVHFGYMIKK